MKVLLIHDNHILSGGAENYFFDLKKRLKKLPGIEVYSLGFGPENISGHDFVILKALKSNIAKVIWSIFFHPFVFWKIQKHIKKVQPDIIHLHNVQQYTMSLLHAIKRYPVVQTIHDYKVICPMAHNIHKNNKPCRTGFSMDCFWKHQVKYNKITYLFLVYAFLKLRKMLKRTVKHFFAPSPLLVTYLKKHGFNKTSFIPPFINKKNSHSFDRLKPHHFLFAGNLGTHKGVYHLIDEFAIAYQHNHLLTLTIIGTGREVKRLQKKVANLGLKKNIIFAGWQDSLAGFYDECAAVIFPSLWVEAFGLVITEGMSFARPIIGSNRGAPPWLIEDKQTGFIFNPLVKGDLANKILTLAGNTELIKKLGENGYKKIQAFNENEASLNEILTTYKTLIRSFCHPERSEGSPQ